MTNKTDNYLWYFGFFSPIIFIFVVAILGTVTPDYNHLRDTISMLAIKKYALFQQINFIQFGLGFSAFAFLFYKNLRLAKSQEIWIRLIIFCLLFFIIIIIFPTDNLSHAVFLQNNLSFNAKVHFSALFLFFILAPLGVNSLSKTLNNEPFFKSSSFFTAKIGFLLTILCYIWTLFFLIGLLNDYKGFFQKIIALITSYWFLRMLTVIKNQNMK